MFVCVCVCVSLSSTLSLLARSTDSTLQTPRPPHSSRAVYVYHKVLARREAWGGRGGVGMFGGGGGVHSCVYTVLLDPLRCIRGATIVVYSV